MKYWNYHRYDKYIAVILVLITIMAVVFSYEAIVTPDYCVYTLNDKWSISKNGEKLDASELAKAPVGIVNTGEVIRLSREIPDIGVDNPCIMFYSIHAIVDVAVDGRKIYAFGHDYYGAGRTVPKRYHAIPLGTGATGKQLEITLTGTCNGSFSGLFNMYIGDRSGIFIKRTLTMRVNLLFGTFLILLGLILMILSPYLVIYHHNDLRLFFCGFISLLLGIYNYSYYGLIDYLTGNAYLNTICEYSSLFNIPTALLGYLMSAFGGRAKKAFRVMFVVNIAVFLSMAALCFTGVSKISDFTGLLHSMALIETLFCLFTIARDYFDKRKETGKIVLTTENVFLAGMVIFMLLSLVDIAIYNYEKYFSTKGESYARLDGFTVGAVIFVSGLLVSYLLYNIQNSNMDNLQKKLTNLAFNDSLTGLSNRARCEQVMDILSGDHRPYTIISLDLNRLKEVNDQYGHHEGDRLLTGFSTILTDCFWDANLIGRMGGDEFIVIMTDEHATSCTRRIHEFYSMLNEWNRKEQVFSYSASYGYAYSYEVPTGSAQEVYMLADSRMYEMKREHHNTHKEVSGNA
ncbi:MAG: GGDEF domain-containing protein [Butyrivibrio sp.]|nr:GGDEF domain-containing protein [Butyrivibrio sp.]